MSCGECELISSMYSRSLEEGSHWISIYRCGQKLIYFDSFGLPPIMKEIKKFLLSFNIEYETNIFEYQRATSPMCGFYVMLFIILMEQNFEFIKFQKLFSQNCKDNDRKVILLLKHVLKKLNNRIHIQNNYQLYSLQWFKETYYPLSRMWSFESRIRLLSTAYAFQLWYFSWNQYYLSYISSENTKTAYFNQQLTQSINRFHLFSNSLCIF